MKAFKYRDEQWDVSVIGDLVVVTVGKVVMFSYLHNMEILSRCLRFHIHKRWFPEMSVGDLNSIAARLFQVITNIVKGMK